MSGHSRLTAIVTGAGGGMGRTCARTLGATMDLVLTDITTEPLIRLADTLRDEGYTILAAEAGDLGDASVLARLTEATLEGNGLGALVHTAGLSPAQADWKTILRVNSLITNKLVDAMEPLLIPGTVGILIASMAGYVNLPMPDADRLLDEVNDEKQLEQIKPFLFGFGLDGIEAECTAAGLAYVLSKRAVIRLCERKAGVWGAHGARMVSISPGLILTPMGRKEAQSDPRTAAILDTQPVNRWGTTMDIAAAVQFLASPGASFITGCDLRVDGGATALTRVSGACNP
jgi:NAD(P)-dependent dehydrogenase (short-subunit alcohol dehydrogenase family)